MKKFFAVRSPLSPLQSTATATAGLMLIIVLWCVASYGGLVKPVFLPTPGNVWDGVVSFNDKGWLIPAIIRSVYRVTQALFYAVVIGVPIGIIMGSFSRFDALLKPFVNGMKAVPTSALIGLIVLWFGITERAILAFLVLGCVFYMIVITKEAILNVREEYIKVAEDFDAKTSQIIGLVLVPAALPLIWNGIIVCNAIAWTYIVLAEYVNMNMANLGVGGLMRIGAGVMQPGQVFAAIFIIAAVANITDFILKMVQKTWLKW